MWTHPLGDDAGDFNTEDIVDARESYGAGDDSDYPTYVELGGDFGTLGLSFGADDSEDMIDGFGVEGVEYLEGLDDASMGRSFRKKLKKSLSAAKAPLSIAKKSVSVAQKLSPTHAIAKTVSPRAIGKWGAKIQNAIAHKKATAAAKITGAATSNSMRVVHTAKEAPVALLTPANYSESSGEVVSTGGQLTEQKLTSTSASSEQAGSFSRSHVHPLLNTMGELPTGYGDDGMGFSFKSVLADAKAKANEELAKLKAKVAADAKARLAQAAGNVSSSLFNKPEVQKAIAEQAKTSAASSIAEKLLDPEVQKKAGIGLGIAAIVGAGLLYAALKNK